MPTSQFDELNNIKRKSIPFKQYFGEMELTDTQKEERINLADKFLGVFDNFFNLIAVYLTIQYFDTEDLIARLVVEYKQALQDFVVIDKQLENYINTICRDIVEGTVKNIDNPYYLSNDRAMFIAENESNTSMNYEELQEAILQGKTRKTWHTMKDKRVRHSHKSVDGKTIPIKKYFSVGGAEMLYPKDIENASDCPEEIVNCRCSISYR